MQYVTLGTVSAALALCAVLAGAFGKSQLAGFFSNPDTAQTVLTCIGSALTLVAGFAKGVKPTA